MAFTKLLKALDLNLPPEERDREVLPDLNGVVDEAPYPGGDGVQQDHIQGGGNPVYGGSEGDIHEGGNAADGVQGDVLDGGNQESKASRMKIWEEVTWLFVLLISTMNLKL
jgi:hypothetical protein